MIILVKRMHRNKSRSAVTTCTICGICCRCLVAAFDSGFSLLLMCSCPHWLATNFSQVQSSKFLVALASKVVLGLGPRRDPRPNVCSFQDCLCVWKQSLLFDERRGWYFLSRRHICCTVDSHEWTRIHTASRYFMDTTDWLTHSLTAKLLLALASTVILGS
jgi:hypothetical protein